MQCNVISSMKLSNLYSFFVGLKLLGNIQPGMKLQSLGLSWVEWSGCHRFLLLGTKPICRTSGART